MATEISFSCIFFLAVICYKRMVFAFVPWATGIACASVAVTMATREISEAQEQMLYDSRRAAAGITPYRPYHPVEKPSIFSPQVSNMVLVRVYNQFFGHGTKDYMYRLQW